MIRYTLLSVGGLRVCGCIGIGRWEDAGEKMRLECEEADMPKDTEAEAVVRGGTRTATVQI